MDANAPAKRARLEEDRSGISASPAPLPLREAPPPHSLLPAELGALHALSAEEQLLMGELHAATTHAQADAMRVGLLALNRVMQAQLAALQATVAARESAFAYRPALLGGAPPGNRGYALLEDVLMMGDGVIRSAVCDFLRQDEARSLRAASRMCREAVAEHPWSDWDDTFLSGKSRILRLSSWRACFPKARAANISFTMLLNGADLVLLQGIHKLNMSHCKLGTITDATFAHLRDIHTLNMSYCDQTTITDAAFAHLRGIHTLNMSDCRQAAITDEAFVHLRGIHTLDMSYCRQVTAGAFKHLAGIHTLIMCRCKYITDAACEYLEGIHTLDISGCNRVFSDKAFVHLKGIHTLIMSNCDQTTITDAAFAHLAGIHTLIMWGCNQSTITDAAFANLRGIHTLSMSGCNKATITDAAFAPLAGVVNLGFGPNDGLTDAAIAHLVGIVRLDITGCQQITNATLAQLVGVNFQRHDERRESSRISSDRDDEDDEL